MLVLSRKVGERILIGDDVVISIERIGGSSVRIGIEAPRSLRVARDELASQGQPLTIDIELNEGEEIDIGQLAARTGLGG